MATKKTASSAASKSKAKSKAKTKVTAQKSAAKKTVAKKTAPKKAAPAKAAAPQKKEKKEVIKKHQSHGKDTGSPKVQVALLTERINQLSAHLEEHPKDNHSRRGLLMMVGKRRKILRYMESKDKEEYGKFIKKLGIRK